MTPAPGQTEVTYRVVTGWSVSPLGVDAVAPAVQALKGRDSMISEGEAGKGPRKGVVDIFGLEGDGAGTPHLPGRPYNAFLDGRLAEEAWGPGHFVVEGRAADVRSPTA